MGVVVAGAVVGVGGRVLVGQRGYPSGLAGRWELPGGKVEAGECDAAALVRECREELGVEVVVGERIGPEVPIPGGRVLRVYAAWLADPQAVPVPVEHAALRWVSAAELDGLDWLDGDRAVLPDLAALLRRPALGDAGQRATADPGTVGGRIPRTVEEPLRAYRRPSPRAY